MNYKLRITKKHVILLAASVYIIMNVISLTSFPFVHSDEAWLSGLSRNILEKGDYSVTESFFDLMERNPHAIKIIFHTIQMLFLKAMGYSIFTFRLISLCFGLLTLYFTYRLGTIIFDSTDLSLLLTLLLSVDVQFIYASHFARQEIIILFLLVLGLYYHFRNSGSPSIKHDMLLGVIIGLGIGIHPNSFIISLPFGLIYLYDILLLKRRRLISLLAYAGTLLCFAAVFVTLSLYLDPNFLTNYPKYGSSFDVFDPITSKLGEMKYFYLKLFYRVSGTYYTPNIKFQFLLFGAALLISVYKLLKGIGAPAERGNAAAIILAAAAVNLGIVLVGRFNQTSFVFIFPLFYILVVYSIRDIAVKYRYAFAAALLAVIIAFTFSSYMEYRDNSYDRYLKEISLVIRPDEMTLGNLNSEYYFDNGKLLDYRNLAFMKEKGISFSEYVYGNNIRYIVFTEELDLIRQLSPKWDGIYGPPDYYDAMKAFLKDNCTLQYEFRDSFYGIRIVRYMGLKDWKIGIYKVIYP